MPLSEHVYCVAITFKMTEWVEQQICNKFCIRLEHSWVTTIRMTQKAAAMGNWWWQLCHNNVPAHASCLVQRSFGKTSNHPGDSAPLQPRFCTLWFLAFPKTKITFERDEISDHWWDSGKYRAADGDWENCVRSHGAYFEETWGVIVLCTMFLVSSIFNKCLYFSCYTSGHLQDKPCIVWLWRYQGEQGMKPHIKKPTFCFGKLDVWSVCAHKCL